MPNKRMQSDLTKRYALASAADARRYAKNADVYISMSEWISKIFLPDEDSWLRHANPWSIWTRFITLPFVAVAVWSRVWIGWYCLIPIAVLVLWIFVNPRIFGKPTHFNSWGSRAVLGEQIYIQRKKKNKLGKHRTPILMLTVLQTIGGIILFFGLWSLNVYLTIYGMTVVYLSKMWFLDRMVWLHADAQEKNA